MDVSRRLIIGALSALGAGLLLSACHQNGIVFAVDVTADTVDATPGDGHCADASGNCSLRAAVMEANSLPGVEEIRLVENETYNLAFGGVDDDDSLVGDLDILEAVVIRGNATIAGPWDLDTLVHVQHTAGLVELDGPNFSNASASVRIDGPGLVNIIRSTFTEATLEVNGGVTWLWQSSFDRRAGAGSQIVANGGSLDLQNVAIRDQPEDYFTDPVIAVDAAAVTVHHATLADSSTSLIAVGGTGSATVASSILENDGSAPLCGNAVVSSGRNVTVGGTCNSPSATDTVTSGTATLAWVSTDGQFGAELPPFHPAVDRGAASGCAPFGVDLWGRPRPSGGHCDVGAHELQYGPCAEWWPGGDFTGCTLSGVNVGVGDLSAATFDDVTIRYSGGFFGTDLTDATFRDANLTHAEFSDVDLTGTDFTGAWSDVFPGPVLIGSGVQGTPSVLPPGWGIAGGHLIGPYGVLPDGAAGVDFTGQGISFQEAFVEGSIAGATFTGLDLRSTTWYFVDFTDADFSGADLRGADLSGAGFSSGAMTSFVGADLSTARFGAAFLTQPDFTDANLTGATISPSFLTSPVFSNTICPSGVNSDANGGNCDGQY